MDIKMKVHCGSGICSTELEAIKLKTILMQTLEIPKII